MLSRIAPARVENGETKAGWGEWLHCEHPTRSRRCARGGSCAPRAMFRFCGFAAILPSRDGARDPPIRPESTQAEALDAKRSTQRKLPRSDRPLPRDGFAWAAALASPAPLGELASPIRGPLARLSGPACR